MTQSLVNSENRRKGHRFEIKIWNKVNHGNCLARSISSGSKGLFDVWSLQKDKLRLIICKYNGYMCPKERRLYAEFLKGKPEFVQVELHYYKSPRKVVKRIVKSEKDLLVGGKESD